MSSPARSCASHWGRVRLRESFVMARPMRWTLKNFAQSHRFLIVRPWIAKCFASCAGLRITHFHHPEWWHVWCCVRLQPLIRNLQFQVFVTVAASRNV
ncbi:hypothetical protein FQZ97_1051610 [compost metagenome]